MIFCRDGSGKITLAEFRQAFRMLKISLTDREIRTLVRELDENGDGQISYEEFLRMCSKDLLSRMFSQDELRQTFAFYDKDNSGYITEDELEEAFKRLGRPFDKNHIKEMFKKYDSDKDGRISFEEFKSLV